MSGLDDPALLKLDASDMFGRIAELGEQLIHAWDGTADLAIPARAADATSIVVTGMGGSATAGDYFVSICFGSSVLPVKVVRGYSVPNYVSERTFVVVSSYSGNTAEALAAYDDAWKRGASMLVVTTGGRLGERAQSDGVPWHHIGYQSLPRVAIAHSLAPLLRAGAMLGLCTITDDDVRGAGYMHSAFVDADLHPSVPMRSNPAKQIAMALHRRTPLILGAEHLAPVAVRFKNQIAENGKTIAAADALPEADHNVVVGLETGKVSGASLSLVTFESQLYDARTRNRGEATADHFEAAGIPVHRIELGGSTLLQQLLLGTAWGDYVSCYLALLNGVDPTPIPQIERLKTPERR